MGAADMARWQAARTVADLAGLTVQWLRGELSCQPSYDRPVDVDEQDAPGLTTALVACNLAGWLTVDSQAGVDDGVWTQLAAVTGFAHSPLPERLAAAVAADGRFRVQVEIDDENKQPQIPVTWHHGQECTWYGGPNDGRRIEETFPDCADAAIDDLYWADQVTVWDPLPGRNELWAFLTQVAENWA
jgi:hypothetical protein